MAEDILISERYSQLENDKKPTAERAEEAALLTLPYAFTEESFTTQDKLNRGYTQGFGASLVNHLVGKLALAILPPSQPFYRLSATQEAMDAVAQGNENAVFEVEKILAQKEEGVLRQINKSDFRSSLYPALRLAVITGNCMIEKWKSSDGPSSDTRTKRPNPRSGYKVINLKDYVVKRDFKGTIVEFIIKETLSYNTLPFELRSKVDEDKQDEDIDLYTAVTLEDGKYVLRQELLGEDVGTEETFDKFTDKFIDVGWNKIDGEDYRRSFVEDHMGTLIALEKLTQAVYEGFAESVKIIKLVNPNGMTKYEDFVDATHGQAIIGHEGDVTTIQSGKAQDLQVAKSMIDEMKMELAKAFLVTGASIRDSERTTAQEVSLVASEVEASLGGIYTAISGDIQVPIVEQAMKEVDVEPGEDIDVIITTGVQALGRNVELNKINGLINELQLLAQIVDPEVVAKTVNVGAIASAIVANSGVASKNFLYSKQEMDQQEMAAKQEAMAQQMIQPGLQQMGQGMGQQITEGGM